jgi:serine/threonine protein kinase
VLRPDELQLPLTVDNFTITRRIGAGAMGEVYLASDVLTAQALAVKVMSSKLVGNTKAETRFRREIAAMGQLRHKGIPSFAGYGTIPGGRPYLAMEYIAGHPLDSFVPEGRPLSEDLALWVVTQVAEVLSFCNRETGMIHRDLKPNNIMVDLRGLPGLCEQSKLCIIDFGLATYIDFGDWDDFGPREYQRAAGATMAGEVAGTPQYMSPEQIRGETLTFHSDIYALGAILYHLLTGQAPYTGPSVGVVMAAHLDSPVPDPSRYAPVRAATVSVVQRAMAKPVAGRFRSYQQLLASLQAARFASEQATRRINRSNASSSSSASDLGPVADSQQPPSTVGTEAGRERPPSASWKRPAAPAQPPPDSSVSTSWRRPPAGAPPAAAITSSWKRPTGPPLPALPALEPGAQPSPREAAKLPPAAAETGADEYPTTPSVQPQQTGGEPSSSTRWRRPVRTPPPETKPPLP